MHWKRANNYSFSWFFIRISSICANKMDFFFSCKRGHIFSRNQCALNILLLAYLFKLARACGCNKHFVIYAGRSLNINVSEQHKIIIFEDYYGIALKNVQSAICINIFLVIILLLTSVFRNKHKIAAKSSWFLAFDISSKVEFVLWNYYPRFLPAWRVWGSEIRWDI